MEFTQLGRTGVKVSRLCLGTMNFGPQTEEADSHAIMDAAHDKGINFFDTANVYGGQDHRGWTEEIVGRWFAGGEGRRERTVLATKVYGDMGQWPNESKLSALNIRRALDASLKRLQTDYIDLYQFHHVDRNTPWDEIWQALETAVAQGKVLYAGSSNFAGWHLSEAQAAAARRNYYGLVSEQSIYNLLNRAIELEVIPAAQHHGIGIIPWSPLAGGLLGGVIRKERDGKRRNQAERIEKHRSSWSSTKTSPRSSATSRASSRWPGCWLSRPSPRRSSARARWTSSTPRRRRSTSRSTARRSRGSTRSSRVTRPRPRTTPGRACPSGLLTAAL